MVAVLTSCADSVGEISKDPEPPQLKLPPAPVALAENTTEVAKLSETDQNGERLRYSLAGGPDAEMVRISPAGQISFRNAPNFEAPADSDRDNLYSFNVSASNRVGSDTQPLNVMVTDVAEPPTISSTPITSATLGELYEYRVTAQDEDVAHGDVLNYALIASPQGMSIDMATGLIRWSPSRSDLANNPHTVTLMVTDTTVPAPYAVEHSYSINLVEINNRPTALTLDNASIGENATAGTVVGRFTVSDPDAGDAHILTIVNDPSGAFGIGGSGNDSLVVLTPNRLDFETTPSVLVSVQATDSGGFSLLTPASFNITVQDQNEPPIIVDPTPQASIDISMAEDSFNIATGQSEPFTLTLVANDPDSDPLVWSVLLNPGNGSASVADSGNSVVVNYVPTANFYGSDQFDVQVDDQNGGTDLIRVVVDINRQNDRPEFTGVPEQINTEGESISAIEIATFVTDADGDSFVYAALELPPGLSIDPFTGVISGAISAGSAGDYQTIITANDQTGAPNAIGQSNTFLWTVVANQPPVAEISAPVDGVTINPGDILLFDAGGSSDPDAHLPLSYQWDFILNANIVESREGVTASLSFNTEGTYQARLIVTDSLGASSPEATLQFTVGVSQLSVDIQSATSVTEGAGVTADFTVTLNEASAVPVTVTYVTQDGTAISGADYTGSTGTELTFSPGGALSQTISIPVTDDATDEWDQTFAVQLQSATNAQLGNSSGTATIIDNDPRPIVSFSGPTTKVVEFVPAVNVSVWLSNPSEIEDFTIAYTVTDGSAISDQDYTHIGNYTVNIPAGSREGIIPFALVSDAVVELKETVSIALNSILPEGAGFGPYTMNVLQIFDNPPWNDTGIDTCTNADISDLVCGDAGDGTGYGTGGGTALFPNQDAEQGRDALASAGQLTKIGAGHAGFDFTKLDANGVPLTDQNVDYATTSWDCVRDNTTGLVWEVKQPINTSGLRAANYAYTWFSSSGFNDGGNPGFADTGNGVGSDNCYDRARCDTEKYVEDINNAGLCGFSTGWRLPTLDELLSIANRKQVANHDPAYDRDYFPNIPPYYSNVWTSLTSANNSTHALTVWADGSGFFGEMVLKTHTQARVRLVRDEP